MDVIYLDKQTPTKEKNLTLLLGNFDGVHLGHQELIFEAKVRGEGKIGVLLFSENPSKFIPNGKSVHELTPLDKKLSLFSSYGVDIAYVVKSEPSLFTLSPNEFIDSIIKVIGPSLIIVGTDYRFGYKASGDVKILRDHFKVVAVPLKEINGIKVGTKEIITFLSKGDIDSANAFLGRPYEIKGKVIQGNHLGRTISFPTANLLLDGDYVLPMTGVYFGIAYLRGLPYKAMINIGNNPTIGTVKETRVEAYLLNANGNFYDATIYLTFLYFRRPETKFENIESLKRQLDADKLALIDYLPNK